MRIRRLFSSVLAGLALMYASGCSNNCNQVAGYNVYGYPYGNNTQAMAYNAAYNPEALVYNNAVYNPGVAPAPTAIYRNAPRPAPRARVKRTKVRPRPAEQRFAQVNPYVYGQPFDIPALNQAVMAPIAAPVAAPIVSTNFGTQVPGTQTLVTDPNFVPTITTNSNGLLGFSNYVNYAPGVTYAPQTVPAVQPMYNPQPVQPAYNQAIPSGTSVDCRTVYRRGRPIKQRFRKVRWVPTAPLVQPVQPAPVYQYQAPLPAPVVPYTPPSVPYVEPYTPPPVVEPYTPPAEPIPAPAPIVEPAPAPAPQQVVSPVISPVIEPVIQPTIEPHIQPVIEPQIKPVIEPTIRTRIEPTPVVEQPVQQPIVQPVVIQPIIQPVIQAPVQQQVSAEIQAPVQMMVPEPVYQPQPVYMAPPPAPVYTPPPMPEPTFESNVMGSAYCPPDICPVPNPVVCQPGQNLSECFTLNDYQIQNSPTQIYTPSAVAPLPISYDAIGGGVTGAGTGTANLVAPAQGGYSATATVSATPMGQATTSKYEALPMPQGMQAPMPDFGVPQGGVLAPPTRADNIPPVPAASEIENALDAMLSRDQTTPNLK